MGQRQLCLLIDHQGQAHLPQVMAALLIVSPLREFSTQVGAGNVGMTGQGRLSLWCLLGALLVMAVSDSTFTYLTEVVNYTTPNLIDAGWVAACVGIAEIGRAHV